MSLDLDAFLTSLQAEGQLDSSGGFTLDRAAARRKLQRYQLADPYHYLLPLVSAAHMAGARRIRIEISAQRTQMEWDGYTLSETEMLQVFSSLFEREHSFLQELAVGLNALQALKPKQVRLHSGDRAVVYQEEHESASPAEPLETTRLAVEHGSWRILQRHFRKSWNVVFPEEAVVREHCLYASAELMVNGAPLPHRGGLENALFSAKIDQTSFGWAPKAESSVVLVLNGVSYPQPNLSIGPPGMRIVAVTPQLSKNLSSSAVVHNEEYRRVIIRLEAETDRLCLEYALQQMESLQEKTFPLYRYALGRAACSGDLRLANSLARRFLAWRESFDAIDRLRMEAHYSVLLLMRESGQAHAYRQALRQLLEWCPQVLGVEPRRAPRADSEFMAVAYWFEGSREKCEQAHLFFLGVEERILGPDADDTIERVDHLRRLYELWGWKSKTNPLLLRLHKKLDSDVRYRKS